MKLVVRGNSRHAVKGGSKVRLLEFGYIHFLLNSATFLLAFINTHIGSIFTLTLKATPQVLKHNMLSVKNVKYLYDYWQMWSIISVFSNVHIFWHCTLEKLNITLLPLGTVLFPSIYLRSETK